MPTESSPASELEPVEATHAIPAAERPAIRITSPIKLLNLVPYMLGFQPDDCTVIIGEKKAGRSGNVLLRIPLGSLADPVVAAGARWQIRRLPLAALTKVV